MYLGFSWMGKFPGKCYALCLLKIVRHPKVYWTLGLFKFKARGGKDDVSSNTLNLNGVIFHTDYTVMDIWSGPSVVYSHTR